MYVIEIEKLEQTPTVTELKQSNNVLRLSFIKSLSVRKLITNGYLVAKHTGRIPLNIKGISLRVVQDLLAMEESAPG